MPFDVTNLDAQTIIFGGLTLVAMSLVTLVGIVVRAYFNQAKNYYNHTNDVISANTSAMLEHAKATQKWSDSLDDLGSVIKEFHKKS